MDEGDDKASDVGFDGRGTPQEKFHWRPVAPTRLDKNPFGDCVEGISLCRAEIPDPFMSSRLFDYLAAVQEVGKHTPAWLAFRLGKGLIHKVV